jgi:eukaryotic-like serine/threonine-protein kinase
VTPERWQEVKKVLGVALEKTPQERSVFLDRACADAGLRREAESLILAHEQGDSTFMGGSIPDLRSDSQLKKGSRLGPYEILSRIGAGGMGTVYRAQDTRLDRAVAVKISTEQYSDRFEREARAIAALNHPNICTLYDVGALPSGTRYLVTELVEGETLQD